MAIQRTFRKISEGNSEELDRISLWGELSSSKDSGWQDLLKAKRVLIVSEAGAGKTYECREQCKRLWDEGAPAFYLELASLATGDIRSLLELEEEDRLDAWLASQSDVATFFLDSIDELKLSLGSFEQALKKLKKGIAGHVARARIVITTRPIPFDEQSIRSILPIPESISEVEPSGDEFAMVARKGVPESGRGKENSEDNQWQTVALMPLSENQILEFSKNQKVDEPQLLLDDLKARDAIEFARRPQDLIELCADWRVSKRIRKHLDQVRSDVLIKLKPRDDRSELAELSVDRAIEGASRIALAMVVTRRFTIRHNAASDDVVCDVPAFDPEYLLSDWSAPERKTLLERALFGFASYGRVRFHHRSIMEYLAAERIRALIGKGMPARAVKRLIFAHDYINDRLVVRPSKRSMAGWLALFNQQVLELLIRYEPSVLLSEGDPESLSMSNRIRALVAYVECYGKGGWRGMEIPSIQIHRFASEALGDTINSLWGNGIENPEIRETLLNLVKDGRISKCSDLVYFAASATESSIGERLAAIEALVKLEDPRLANLGGEIASNAEIWSDNLSHGAVLRLFPTHLSVDNLCRIVARIKENENSIGGLSWQLSRLIVSCDLDTSALVLLRDSLVGLATAGLRWDEGWPHIVSDLQHLNSPLAATCLVGFEAEPSKEWLQACVIALRLTDRDHHSDEAILKLKKLLSDLSAQSNEKLFWVEDAFVQSIHPISDPWNRLAEVILHGVVRFNRGRDWNWIRKALSDCTQATEERSMLLHAAIRLPPSEDMRKEHISGLKDLVADQAELLGIVKDSLKPRKSDKGWEVKEAKRKKQLARQEAKAHASWVVFWREVAENPDDAFSPDRSGNTVWNLWRAMDKVGTNSRDSGWNRRFIESHFSEEIANRMRLALMKQWREDRPTLSSERSEDAKNTYLVQWQLGLAGIYAEAEDSEWATKLSTDEAELAVRYAPLELNSLPTWIDPLAKAHPKTVDKILGEELIRELNRDVGAEWHSMLVQKIRNSSEYLAIFFLPRFLSWLDINISSITSEEIERGVVLRFEEVVEFLFKHGCSKTRLDLSEMAKACISSNYSSDIKNIWLVVLMRTDALAGVEVLEELCKEIEPEKRSKAVSLFGLLFGRHYGRVSLADLRFEPDILLRLMRLAYRHVRPQDDVEHDGSYTPDDRDNAEDARNNIVNSLFKTPGEAGWKAKIEMSDDPVCAHFRDRIIAVAEEQLSEEIDMVAFDDVQAITLDKTGEGLSASNEAMFSLMVDRLEDIDELLCRPESPHEAWALIKHERIMRREIARSLTDSSNGIYLVDQEAVTAEEKETDIRLRSATSPFESVIELKLADGRTAVDLRDTLENQLVAKYLASEFCRSGCLLITLAKNRKWNHPDSGSRIGVSKLLELLRVEAENIVKKLGGSLRLHVHLLDLRPRLTIEKAVKDHRGDK